MIDTIGSRIARLREQNGLSQADLAKRMNISLACPQIICLILTQCIRLILIATALMSRVLFFGCCNILMNRHLLHMTKKSKCASLRTLTLFCIHIFCFYSTFIIRYPTPICVCIYCGESGSASSFLRSVAMNTRREATSLSQLLPQIFCVM